MSTIEDILRHKMDCVGSLQAEYYSVGNVRKASRLHLEHVKAMIDCYHFIFENRIYLAECKGSFMQTVREHSVKLLEKIQCKFDCNVFESVKAENAYLQLKDAILKLT